MLLIRDGFVIRAVILFAILVDQVQLDAGPLTETEHMHLTKDRCVDLSSEQGCHV